MSLCDTSKDNLVKSSEEVDGAEVSYGFVVFAGHGDEKDGSLCGGWGVFAIVVVKSLQRSW